MASFSLELAVLSTYAPHAPVQRLYLSHSGWLLGFLHRRLGNRVDAADLLHDTFVRVMGRPAIFDCALHERSYLATIARGLCVDHWRRRQLEQAWLHSLALQPEGAQPSLEHRHLILETLHEVDGLLARLPNKVREAFLLAQLDGMPYRAIATQLGVSERMVKKYMAQALLHCALLEAELDGLLVR
jgi:RNA polymerase sigma-70 factor (ECF subfamily)